MFVALLLGGVYYAAVVQELSAQIGQLAPPILPTVVAYTLVLVAISVVGHIAIAVFSPKEASASLDEREKAIYYRASHLSGYVLGTGLFFSLAMYLFAHHGDLLFYGVFASIMLSELAEYLIQIVLYRVGV
jgi:hypothetical protein